MAVLLLLGSWPGDAPGGRLGRANAAENPTVNESVSIALGASPAEQGIAARPGDGEPDGLVAGELDGRTYWQTNRSADDESKRILYFYMNVDDGYSANMAAYDVEVTVDYYDAGSGKLVLQYDAQGDGNGFKDAPLFSYGDTGAWKTHTYKLTDANFANRTGGSDFRIGIEGGGASWQTNAELKLARVVVTKTLKAAAADEASIALGETAVEHGIVGRGGDNESGLVKGALDGKGYWKTNRGAPGDRTLYLYMNVDDAYLYDNADKDVYVTVEYLDQGSGSFVLQYDALSAAFKDSPLFTYGNSGQWKTKTFKLIDARFANRTNGSDFRIGISGGGNPDNNPDLTVARVSVKKVARTSTATQTKVYDTQFATDDVVIADFSVRDFGAKADGESDDTAAFQAALDASGGNGGGVVFAPAGTYRLNGHLNVPTGVTLRGDWISPDEAGGQVLGTVLASYGGRGQADGESFIQLQPVSGVTNLSVWYPEQTLSDPAAYPWTFEQLPGDSATMENITLVNSYGGIKIGPEWNELHYVKNLYGTVLHSGIFLDFTTDIGRLEGIRLAPSYWATSGLAGAPDAGQLRAYTTTHAEGIVMGRSDWEYMSDIHLSGFDNGMRVTTRTGSAETANAQLYDVHVSDSRIGLKIEGVNDYGLLVTRSSFAAGVGESPAAIYATAGFHSIAQFQDVQVDGSGGRAVVSEGSGVLSFENAAFAGWDDANGRYAIELGGGSLILGQSSFAKAAKQVKLTGAAQALNAVNAGLDGSLQVTDESQAAEVNVTQNAGYALERLPSQIATDAAVRPKPASRQLFDATAAPYNADRGGVVDASVAIQQALDAAEEAGGGTVYLPAGIYRVDSPLTVPSGVELRGSWDVPHHTIGGGTVLFTRYGQGAPEGATALITLAASAGVRGLSVYYDEQNWNNAKPYAWTIRGEGHGVYAIDTTLINSYQGIDFGTYDTSGHYIDYVAGSPLMEGIYLGGGAEGGVMRNVQFNPHYYGRNNYPNHPSTDADFDKVWSYQKEHLDAFRIGHVDGETIFNTFVYGSQYGIHFAAENGEGPVATVLGHGTDGSKKGVYLEGAGEKGLTFVNTELVSMSSTDKVYITLEDGFDAEARFFNTSMWGDTSRSVDIRSGRLRMQQSNFTTVGEKGINALGGDVALYDSYFQQPRTTHVYAGPDIERMTLTNNLFKGGLQLVNEAGVKVGGSNLVPVALRLEKTALDPAHMERSNARLVLSNATDAAALSGKIELVQPSAYAGLLKPIRFADIAYGESVEIDLPYLAGASLKFKVTLDDGRTYLSSVKLGQTFAGPFAAQGSDAPRIDLSAQDEYAGGGRSGTADLSADAGVAWDNDKLYFDIDVRDDVHNQSYGGVDIWQGDSIQLGIDLNRDAGAGSKQVSELGFALRDDGSVVKWRWKAPEGLQTGALGAGVEATVTRDEGAGVTHYAIAIPLEQLHGAGYDFDPRSALGFTLLMNENDGSGREGYMEYNQGIGASKDFTLFGDLYLLDGSFLDWSMASAQAAVAAAKLEKSDTSIDAARNFVVLLPEGADRTALAAELDALEEEGGEPTTSPTPTPTPTPTPPPVQNGPTPTPTSAAGTVTLTPAASVDAASGLVRATVGKGELDQAYAKDGVKLVKIVLSSAAGATGYAVELPSSALADGGAERRLELSTPLGTVAVTGDMLTEAGLASVVGGKITLVVRAADRKSWSEELGMLLGDRPAVDVSLMSGGVPIAWRNGDSSAIISIPYSPAANEAGHPEKLTIRYIDEHGGAHPVVSGHYDAARGVVTFRTTHFSQYAVAYVDRSFVDLGKAEWAREAVEALAARGIVEGRADGNYAPGEQVSRADFLLLLVRMLELNAKSGDADAGFADVPPSRKDGTAEFADVAAGAYFADAVRVGVALGIAGGSGDGRFLPLDAVSRQEAAAMVARALRSAGAGLPEGGAAALAAFADESDAAAYARPDLASLVGAGLMQGAGGKLRPQGQLTRAEAAVLLYRVYERGQ
ncbi:S-layer homology domain-containing protein [Cohnella hashimotonis]|uniref:Glycosyl hydrolase family 28-related protein n=1 Tax=Cohnella hashimotonis TaxID=2826895 RepID=A0ABT6TJ44_9BACL|nr:glycosyl hydrolase family 28-related protein [Cohnella hashimotonis]MDI4646858.1 glycosyl hydrolase family 28-related protein [Cohnella hashimotonis]